MQTIEAPKESLELLEDLDFTPEIPCSRKGCENVALVMLQCRQDTSFIKPYCGQCLGTLRLLVAITSGCKCGHCGEFGPRLEDATNVIEI